MKTPSIIQYIAVAGMLLPLTVSAQKKPYSEEVTVVAPYQPTLSEANKININPQITDTVQPKPSFQYSIQSTPYPTVYKPETIEAAKMAGEPINKLYENLLKLGIGSYVTPYAEYFFNSTRSKELAYGAHIKHLSTSGKIKDYAYPGYSDNQISGYARKFVEKKYNLQAEGGFSREVVHYYGFDPSKYNPAPSDNDIRQRFNLGHLTASIVSAKPDSTDLAYQAVFTGYHLADKYKSRETHISLQGGVEKTQSLLKISKEQRWGIHGGVQYFNDQADGRASQGRALLTLRPFLYAQRAALHLKVGFNATIEADTTSFFHLYPEIELRARVIPNWVTLFAGVTGQMERNSYRKFITGNPFVSPQISLSFLNTQYRFYGGLDANIANLFDVTVELSRSRVKGQYFYINTPFDSLQNKFSALYDDDCDIFEMKSELAWHYNQHFGMIARFHLHQYFTSEALPWHISDYDVSLSATYNIQKKIYLDAGFFYYDRMYALEYNPLIGNIEPIFLRDRIDLNLGVEYKYSRLISGFLRFNNISSIRYYYWNNYPSQKFNLMGGVTFSF